MAIYFQKATSIEIYNCDKEYQEEYLEKYKQTLGWTRIVEINLDIIRKDTVQFLPEFSYGKDKLPSFPRYFINSLINVAESLRQTYH